MFTLIQREMESIAVYLVVPLVIMALIIVFLFSAEKFDAGSHRPLTVPPAAIISFWLIASFLSLYFAGIGFCQSYSDRNAKVSFFLCTLATTRQQIFAAKIIAGVAAITVSLIPLFGAYAILLAAVPPQPILSPAGLLVRMFAMAFLANLVGYGLGLLLGWHPRRITPWIGPLLISFVILSVIYIKGFSLAAGAVLLMAAAAALGRAWQKFLTMPLQ